MDSSLHCLAYSALVLLALLDAVHHNVDGMLFLLVQSDSLGKLTDLSVQPDPGKACLGSVAYKFLMLPFLAIYHRCKDSHLGAVGESVYHIQNLVHRLLVYLPAALGTVHHTDPCKEKTEVVVDFCHCSHCGTGVPVGGLLLYGDGRRKPLDIIQVRLLHPPQEHPGIG